MITKQKRQLTPQEVSRRAKEKANNERVRLTVEKTVEALKTANLWPKVKCHETMFVGFGASDISFSPSRGIVSPQDTTVHFRPRPRLKEFATREEFKIKAAEWNTEAKAWETGLIEEAKKALTAAKIPWRSWSDSGWPRLVIA